MHRQIEPQEVEYVKRENRAFEWYLAARLLILEELLLAAAFSSQQTIELLLKASLVYWDKDFRPRKSGHDFAELLERVRTTTAGAAELKLPAHLMRYQSQSRYISLDENNVLGFVAKVAWIDDLDTSFFKLIALVPFHFNTALTNALTEAETPRSRLLERENGQAANLRKMLQPWLRRSPGALSPFPTGY